MPSAHARQVKYHYEDHDTDEALESPPVQNTWYEVFDAEDVRLVWCTIYQDNDENAAKTIEVRWTVDGTEYLYAVNLPDDTIYFVYRGQAPSAAGTAGLLASSTRFNAGYRADKRGNDFKVEMRMTAVPGTNQVLRCRCVRETKEET